MGVLPNRFGRSTELPMLSLAREGDLIPSLGGGEGRVYAGPARNGLSRGSRSSGNGSNGSAPLSVSFHGSGGSLGTGGNGGGGGRGGPHFQGGKGGWGAGEGAAVEEKKTLLSSHPVQLSYRPMTVCLGVRERDRRARCVCVCVCDGLRAGRRCVRSGTTDLCQL